MRFSSGILSMVLVILLMTDCREPFQPDFETGVNDFLVVEGFIHVGENVVTEIKLSRVAPIGTNVQTFEDNATLTIESEAGDQFPLISEGNGIYKSLPLSLDHNIEYRLMINFLDGSAYASEYTKPKITPQIDSVHWKKGNDGIKVYVASHDPEGQTKYYKWDYTETWEFHAAYVSTLIYNATENKFEPFSHEGSPLYRCWKSLTPPDLCFGSSTQFISDAVNFPLVAFGSNSQRASVRYSIIVEQRALTNDEFNYLTLIQKNSILTGSLFDPLPSEIYGNIRSISNSDEVVVGYIGASTTFAKRIFVTKDEFDEVYVPECDRFPIRPKDFQAMFGSGVYMPIDYGPAGTIYGARTTCMDCRQTGTNHEPDFWN